AAAAVASVGLFLAPVAHAQQGPSAKPPETSTAPQNIPDHKLDAVAAAAKNVASIGDSYEQKLANAPKDQKEQIVNHAHQAITKGATDQGLSVDEYLSIMKGAQNDPAVRDKIVQRLK